MNDSPFFSICIPTYNRADLLSTALQSALSQTDQDYEILVVDNASTDNTQEILKRYDDPRIRTIRNPETVSMNANHNICIQHARAPWIVFLHSDDRLCSTALEELRHDIQHYSDVDVICSPLGGWKNVLNNLPMMLRGREGLITLLRWHAPTQSGCAYRKNKLRETNFSVIEIAGDYMLLFDLINTGSAALMRQKSIITVGEGEHQYSNKWMISGGYTRDVARIVGKIMDALQDFHDVSENMKHWSSSEIADLLMFAAHDNKYKYIDDIELLLRPRSDYKKSPHYRHVMIGKLFGRTILTKMFITTRQVKRHFRR